MSLKGAGARTMNRRHLYPWSALALAVGAFVASPAVVLAQQEPLVRTVILVDDFTSRPVVGAEVSIEPGGIRRVTGAGGAFQAPLGAGAYTLTATALGYLELSVSIEVPATPTAPLELRMAPAPIGLEGLDVEAEEGEPVDVTGVVRDAVSGRPLVGATVSFPFASRRWVDLTDPEGVFRIDGVRPGAHWVQARQLGYEGAAVSVAVGAHPAEPVEIQLRPDSVLLRGVAQINERWRADRRSVAKLSVRTLDRERIASAPGWRAKREVWRSVGVWVVPCEAPDAVGDCVQRRGGTVEVSVCIDGVPAIGGLDQLRTYHPRELHLVEVFGGGSYVQAYTEAYMERYGRRPGQAPNSCPDPRLN